MQLVTDMRLSDIEVVLLESVYVRLSDIFGSKSKPIANVDHPH